MIFQAKSFNHPDTAEAFLRVVIQGGKCTLRCFKALMQLLPVTFDSQSHQRHRQQGKQCQLPADLNTHRQQDHQPHDKRIHQRQHPFSGGKHHFVHIIGTAGDQVTGPVTVIKGRRLAAELLIKILTQTHRQLVGGTE